MNKEELTKILIESIEELQKQFLDEMPKVNLQTKPIGDIPGFDSLRGVALAAELEGKLDITIPINNSLIISKNNAKPLSISEITEKLYDLVN